MRISEYPAGTRIELRFCFANRRLTRAERETYEENGTLPEGVAYEVDEAFAEYRDPDTGTITTVAGASITHRGFGSYAAKLVVPRGRTRWQGFGKVGGEQVAATPVRVILGTGL